MCQSEPVYSSCRACAGTQGEDLHQTRCLCRHTVAVGLTLFSIRQRTRVMELGTGMSRIVCETTVLHVFVGLPPMRSSQTLNRSRSRARISLSLTAVVGLGRNGNKKDTHQTSPVRESLARFIANEARRERNSRTVDSVGGT